MQYNPIVDLVLGIVMILVPLLLFIVCGTWLILSIRKEKSVPAPPPPPEKRIDEEILRSLELLQQHQGRLLEEMRDVSEENRKSLRVLQEETERIRNLLRKEIGAQSAAESRWNDLDYRDN